MNSKMINKTYFAALDIARFFFALMMMLYHFYGILPDGLVLFGDERLNTVLIGSVVWYLDFFFMCSGFCISSAYQNWICEISFREFMGKQYRKFLVYTLLTIVPAFIARGIIGFTGKDKMPSVRNAVASVFMIDAVIPSVKPYNGPLWYLSSLLVCYCLYYMIEKRICQKYGISFMMISGILTVIFAGLSIMNIPVILQFSHLIQGGRGFFLGGVCFELYKRRRYDKFRIGKWMLSMICLASFVFYIMYAGRIPGKYMYLIIDICFLSCLILVLSHIEFKMNSISRALGLLSVSIFVWHDIVIYFVQAFHCAQWIDKTEPHILLISIILVFVISIVSSKFMEPFMKNMLFSKRR